MQASVSHDRNETAILALISRPLSGMPQKARVGQ